MRVRSTPTIRSSSSSSSCFSSLSSTTLFHHFKRNPLSTYRRHQSTFEKVNKDSSQFNKISDKDISHFQNILGNNGVITNKDDLKVYNTDWMNKYHGNASVALRPCKTEQVSEILSYCNENKLAVVPQGGNTGLVGGSVPVHDEVIISTNRMNRIRYFDSSSGILICDAGCILQDLDGYLKQYGHMMPLDLGAKGSCEIGGNVATNAGGIRFLRYGSLHGNIRDVEVVLPDGRILRNSVDHNHDYQLNTLDKDNTGYHLKNLFIGSEGTLGIITGVSIKTMIQPNSKMVSLLALKDFDSLCNVFHTAKLHLGETLSAFEFFDFDSVSVVQREMTSRVRYPLSQDEHYPFHALLEVSGSNAAHNEEKLNHFLENVMESGHVVDGTIAQDETQAAEIWTLRDSITEALSHSGTVFKYDISLPIPKMYDIVDDVRKYIQQSHTNAVIKDSTVVGFGHLGDGNLHLNISCPLKEKMNNNNNNNVQNNKSDDQLRVFEKELENFVFKWVSDAGGSISAEHGLGQMKARALHYSKSSTAIAVMKEIKKLFDPVGIMNPNKVLI